MSGTFGIIVGLIVFVRGEKEVLFFIVNTFYLCFPRRVVTVGYFDYILYQRHSLTLFPQR